MPLVNATEVAAAAVAERTEEVKTRLVSKYKVISKRNDAVAAFKAAHDKKVAAFEAAVAAAETPEQIEAAIDSKEFSFNERFYPLCQG